MSNGLKQSLFWSMMEQGGMSLVGFVVQIILARLLAPEAFGVMAILLVFTTIIDAIAQSGLGLALIQKQEVDDSSYSTAFWLSLCMAIVLYAILFLCAPLVSIIYQMDDMTPLLRVLGITVLFNSFNSIQRAYLQREIYFKRLFKANSLGYLLAGAFGVCLAFMGFGIWALVGQAVAQSLCLCLMLLIFVPWKPSASFDRSQAKELFGFGWKMCATTMINTLHDGISELIIGKACDAASLGYYSQGRKYPKMVIGIITNALSNVFLPVFSRMKGEMSVLWRSVESVLSVGTFIIAPFSALLCVIAEPIVLILLGEKWLPSVFIFQLAFAQNVFLMFQIVNLRTYVALGKSDLFLKINLIKASYSVILICIAAIVTQDIYITAVVMTLCNITGIFFVDMAFAKKAYGYSAAEQVKDQRPTLLITLAAFLLSEICRVISTEWYLVAIAQVVVFASVYMLVSVIANKRTLEKCLTAFKNA